MVNSSGMGWRLSVSGREGRHRCCGQGAEACEGGYGPGTSQIQTARCCHAIVESFDRACACASAASESLPTATIRTPVQRTPNAGLTMRCRAAMDRAQSSRRRLRPTHIGVAYIVMAFLVMAYVVMAYIAMSHIVMATGRAQSLRRRLRATQLPIAADGRTRQSRSKACRVSPAAEHATCRLQQSMPRVACSRACHVSPAAEHAACRLQQSMPRVACSKACHVSPAAKHAACRLQQGTPCVACS